MSRQIVTQLLAVWAILLSTVTPSFANTTAPTTLFANTAPTTHNIVSPATSTSMATLVNQLKKYQSTAPLVFSYHNITETQTGKSYDVSASDFRNQMKLLSDAGYTSLTSAQYLQFLAGNYTPPANSFLLTFDDGITGTFLNGDPILKEFGFHGVATIITQSVGTHRPYYATWDEIRQINATGRWSFGSHTSVSHRRHLTLNGKKAPAFVTRDYSGATPETLSQFKERVEADVAQVAEDFKREGIPLTPLFAWPFSATDLGPNSYRNSSRADEQAAKIALDVVNKNYQLSFTNLDSPRPSTYVQHNTAPVERLGIRNEHTLNDFVKQVVATKELPIDVLYNAASEESAWSQYFVPVSGPVDPNRQGIIALPSGAQKYQAEWNVSRTHQWPEQIVRAVMGGSNSPGASESGLLIDFDRSGYMHIGATSSSIYINVRDSSNTTRLVTYEVTEATRVYAHVTQSKIIVWLSTGQEYEYTRPDSQHPLGAIGVRFKGDSTQPTARPQIADMQAAGGRWS